MTACQELRGWFDEHVQGPLDRFYREGIRQCEEARRQIATTVRTPIERYREELERRCRATECFVLCLCCNKWFCWLVPILLRLIEWAVAFIIEVLVELLCKLLVTLIWLAATAIARTAEWALLALLCLLEVFCGQFVLLGALALLVALLALVALATPLAPGAAALLPLAFIAGGIAFLLARFLCRVDSCRIAGAVGWALKWAMLLGAFLSLATLSALSGAIAVTYGGLVGALIVTLESGSCRIPTMKGLP